MSRRIGFLAPSKEYVRSYLFLFVERMLQKTVYLTPDFLKYANVNYTSINKIIQ